MMQDKTTDEAIVAQEAKPTKSKAPRRAWGIGTVGAASPVRRIDPSEYEVRE